MASIWKWAAASRCGTAHAQVGDRRQDAYRVVTADPGFVIAVACDGAGSASQGGSGAAIAARFLSERVKIWITHHGVLPSPAEIENWVAEARDVIAACAQKYDLAVGEFATTVVMTVSDGTFTLTAHIGDGAVIARCCGATTYEALSWPEVGEYASTTFFLTDAVLRLRIGIIEACPIDRIAVLTDGLERLALDFRMQAAHEPFFTAMFAPVVAAQGNGHDMMVSRQLATFLDSDTVTARTDDDKTLLLAAFG